MFVYVARWQKGATESTRAAEGEIALKTEASCSLVWELLTGSSQTHFPLFHGQAEVRGGGGGTVRNSPPGRPVRVAFSPPLTESRPSSVPCTSAAPSAARTGPWSGAEAAINWASGEGPPHISGLSWALLRHMHGVVHSTLDLRQPQWGRGSEFPRDWARLGWCGSAVMGKSQKSQQ